MGDVGLIFPQRESPMPAVGSLFWWIALLFLREWARYTYKKKHRAHALARAPSLYSLSFPSARAHSDALARSERSTFCVSWYLESPPKGSTRLPGFEQVLNLLKKAGFWQKCYWQETADILSILSRLGDCPEVHPVMQEKGGHLTFKRSKSKGLRRVGLISALILLSIPAQLVKGKTSWTLFTIL